MTATLADVQIDELKGQLDLCHAAMAATSCGVTIADAGQEDMPLIYANAAFEQLTGYATEDVIGRNCRFLGGDDPRNAEARRTIRESIATETDCNVLLFNRRKDGTPFWNELHVAPILGEDGRATHFVGIQTNVTARVEAERREREVLEKTLAGSVKSLIEALSMVQPLAHGRALRVGRLGEQLAAFLPEVEPWELSCAALLSQIGCITLPQDLVAEEYGDGLDDAEKVSMYAQHAEAGGRLLETLPRMERIATAVRHQAEPFGGEGDAKLKALCAALRMLVEFDRQCLRLADPASAFIALESSSAGYDQAMLEAFANVIPESVSETDASATAGTSHGRPVNVEDLENGMILARNVDDENGLPIVLEGQEITTGWRLKLRNLSRLDRIGRIVFVQA